MSVLCEEPLAEKLAEQEAQVEGVWAVILVAAFDMFLACRQTEWIHITVRE